MARGTRYAAAMMRWLTLCSFAVFGALACGESRLLDDFTEQGTRVRITPEVFRGSVPCRSGVAGALQMYAVRFFARSETGPQPDAGLFEVLSPGVPCERAIAMEALAGLRYGADIYGFDRVLGAGEVPLTEARWTASCGRGDFDGPLAPTLAVYGTLSSLTGCTTFSGEGAGRTLLVIDQASALGSLRCGTQPGQVVRLEGVLDGVRISAPCGQPLALEVGVAGLHTIELTAFEAVPGAVPVTPEPPAPSDVLDASVPTGDAGGDAAAPIVDAGAPPSGVPADAGAGADAGPRDVARWRSECVGRAQAGLSSVASCEPLQALP